MCQYLLGLISKLHDKAQPAINLSVASYLRYATHFVIYRPIHSVLFPNASKLITNWYSPMTTELPPSIMALIGVSTILMVVLVVTGVSDSTFWHHKQPSVTSHNTAAMRYFLVNNTGWAKKPDHFWMLITFSSDELEVLNVSLCSKNSLEKVAQTIN